MSVCVCVCDFQRSILSSKMDQKDASIDQNEQSSGWFDSFVNKAKSKSSQIVDFMKKDLEEFGSTVKTEASNAVTSTSSFFEKTLKLNDENSTTCTIKRNVSQFLEQVNTAFYPEQDDSGTDALVVVGDEAIELTKLECAILELQKDEKTYLEEHDQSLDDQFRSWLTVADEQITKEVLSKYLSNSYILNEQYMKLVPDHVSHSIFWKRYLFKKALLEDTFALEERRSKKEPEICDKINLQKEIEESNFELNEEEQNKILEDYEKELQQNQSKSISKNSSADSLDKIESNSNSDSDWVDMSLTNTIRN